MPGSAFNAMFTLVPLFIGLVFVVVIGSIIINAGKSVLQWSENNAQPVLAQDATVVSKRTEVSGSRERSATSYYLTFELSGGERREFGVSGTEYGLQAEGDFGQLRYQGARYLGFVRSRARFAEPLEPEPPVAPAGLACNYCGSVIPNGSIKCGSCGWTWRPQPAEAKAT